MQGRKDIKSKKTVILFKDSRISLNDLIYIRCAFTDHWSICKQIVCDNPHEEKVEKA